MHRIGGAGKWQVVDEIRDSLRIRTLGSLKCPPDHSRRSIPAKLACITGKKSIEALELK